MLRREVQIGITSRRIETKEEIREITASYIDVSKEDNPEDIATAVAEEMKEVRNSCETQNHCQVLPSLLQERHIRSEC